MKRTILSSLMLMCLFTSILAQRATPIPDVLDRKITEAARIQTEYSPEQVFLFTDRDIYSAGDTIWLNVWSLAGHSLLPEGKSRIVHVDLIDANNKILQDLLIEIVGGVGSGAFYISENLDKEGIFRIRGYTLWNLNFGNDYVFYKNIPVWKKTDAENNNLKNKKYEAVLVGNRTILKKIRNTNTSETLAAPEEEEPFLLPDIQFLPEGGKWYAGIPSRIAFKAISPDGYGVELKGDIIDENDSVITEFNTEHLGMGSIMMIPEKNKKYRARIITGQTFPLPEVYDSGAGIQINPFRNNRISGTIYFTPDMVSPNAEYYLTTGTADDIRTQVIYADKPRVSFEIPFSELPGGITEFTLFDPYANPVAGRICFVPSDTRLINMEWTSEIVTATVPGDGSGSVLNLTLKTTSAYDNKPVSSLVSLALTDSLYSPVDEARATLRSQMLLSGMLKGKVENPDYYFANPYDSIYRNLDLVMLTHGWRNFMSIPDTSAFTLGKYNNFNISGRVSNAFNSGIKQPLALIAQGEYSFTNETISDNKGHFMFENLPLTGMTYISLVATTKKNKVKNFNIGIEVASIPTAKKPDISELDMPWSISETTALLDEFKKRKDNEQAFLDSLTRIPGMQYIDPVTITAQRFIKGSYNRNKPGNADIILDDKELGKYDMFTDMMDVLQNEFPGFGMGWFGNPSANGFRYFSKSIKSNYIPLFAYYDRPVYFRVDGFDMVDYIKAATTPPSGFIISDYLLSERLEILKEALSSISVSDLEGIEIMTNPNYTWIYNNIINPETIDPDIKKPVYIEITTKTGTGHNYIMSRTGIKNLRMRGVSIPKEFYTPKYIPEEYADRFQYHRKPTLYWNPAIATNNEGVAKISIPVGSNYPRTLQIISEGHNLRGKIGSGMQTIKVGTGKGAW